jgi:hypothetical protein
MFSACQENRKMLWNPEFRHGIKMHATCPYTEQINPVRAPTPSLENPF